MVLTWIPFTEASFVPSLVEIRPVILEWRLLNSVNISSLFRYHLFFKTWVAQHLNKVKLYLHKYFWFFVYNVCAHMNSVANWTELKWIKRFTVRGWQILLQWKAIKWHGSCFRCQLSRTILNKKSFSRKKIVFENTNMY